MCVTLYLVLSNYITVDENRLEDWFAAYIGKLEALGNMRFILLIRII